ncbi:hypothetical protein ACYSNU_14820 [Enterococcus sp. LJL120]
MTLTFKKKMPSRKIFFQVPSEGMFKKLTAGGKPENSELAVKHPIKDLSFRNCAALLKAVKPEKNKFFSSP